ncbi:Coq4 family protein [Cyanobium sp. Morenito 9A2]|uniref:Coq4 family protein n=1 Tax=Cyanobium sp. Morenito 9A2 TaxID=2823718 RepID=UPI0020CE3B20|nr:Coq4 family protein [Cyanobium sp. Morenito 9A2]MCP9848371.1 hypothetical protein [Cyanobium sp. Morenito 9A2]
MARLKEVLRAARSAQILGAISRSGGALDSIADLVDNFLDSEAMALSVERFRLLPGGAELLAERPVPVVPNLDVLLELPAGSLGHTYALVIKALGYDPDFARPRPVDSEAGWLTQRIATTHDVHHVISGFGPLGEGENGVLAITATQIGYPAFVVLNIAAGFASVRFHPERLELVNHAIARGSAMGLSAAPLCAQRWEEGWDRPVHAWRRQLGVSDPVITESYSLAHRLPELGIDC